jgi:hypothetical protein
VGGVVGGAAGYGIGKHIDNKQKERARIAAANRAAANRAAANRAAANRAAVARNTNARRNAAVAVPANSLVAAPAAVAYDEQATAINSAYLPNNANGDPSHPYATSEYRRKSW